MKIGNKLNSFLNGAWARHVRGFYKQYTSSRRRTQDREVIKEELINDLSKYDDEVVECNWLGEGCCGHDPTPDLKSLDEIKGIRKKSLMRKQRNRRRMEKEQTKLSYERQREWREWRTTLPRDHIF